MRTIPLTKEYFIIPSRKQFPLRHDTCRGSISYMADDKGAIECHPDEVKYKRCLYCDIKVDPKVWVMYKLWALHNNK